MTRYTVVGKGDVNLTDADYQTEGGEGKIYLKSPDVFKIYHDPANLPPQGKIAELAVLKSNPYVICPVHMIKNSRGFVGFTMPEVPKPYETMPSLFATNFRTQQGITPEKTRSLVMNMRSVIAHIHAHGCVVVDMNENNNLIDSRTWEHAYFIDTCAYKTPSYPATAIMPSIRDYTSKEFTPLTDWFSFGILACQLYVGIHPYRGNHPQFKKGDFQSRILAHVSIFNPETRYPSAVRDFNLIPDVHRAWMLDVFERGKRLPFPDQAGKIGVVLIQAATIFETGNFILGRPVTFSGEILAYIEYMGRTVVHLAGTSLLDGRPVSLAPSDMVAFTPKLLRPYKVGFDRGDLITTSLDTGKLTRTPVNGERVDVFDNRIYVLSDERLTEFTLVEMGDNDIVAPNASWMVLPGYTSAWDGLYSVNALGMPHLIIPSGERACHFIKAEFLKGKRIVAARYRNRVAMLIVQDGPTLTRHVLRFDSAHQKFDHRESPTDLTDLNFIVLDTGTCVCIPDDGLVEVFQNDPSNAKLRTIQDAKIKTNMRLAVVGSRASVLIGDQMQTISMKP